MKPTATVFCLARKERFNPKVLLRSIMDEFKILLGNNLLLKLMSQGTKEIIITDPDILRQIITALLSYISENMPSGVIDIFMDSNPYESDNLIITMEGTEWLVPETKLSKLFSGKTSRLANAKLLVKQLGGKIKAANGMGKGTTFIVTLPVERLPSSKFSNNTLGTIH